MHDVIDCRPSNTGPAGKPELPLRLSGLCNARLGDVIARAHRAINDCVTQWHIKKLGKLILNKEYQYEIKWFCALG